MESVGRREHVGEDSVFVASFPVRCLLDMVAPRARTDSPPHVAARAPTLPILLDE